MGRRRYRTKNEDTVAKIGEVLVALGGVFMLVLALQGILNRSSSRYGVQLFTNIDPLLYGIISLVCGALLIFSVYANEKGTIDNDVIFVILTLVLEVIGGTTGALIAFAGTIIYMLVFIID